MVPGYRSREGSKSKQAAGCQQKPKKTVTEKNILAGVF